MIKVEEALKIILENIKVLDTEKLKIRSSLGQVLAEDVYSDLDIPPFDNSAMDGYALIASDAEGASSSTPKILQVVEDLKAGYLATKSLRPGETIRIMTGAPLPAGADSVIMVEDTGKVKDQRSKIKNKEKEFVSVYREVKRGENIRRAGEDVKKGDLVIEKGGLVGPAEIGMLASLGKVEVDVIRRPKVAILATGDELVDADEALAPGKIRSSNTYTLYGQVIQYGGIPIDLGIARDEPQEVRAKIRSGLDSDMILTSGGVSVGDYDLVKEVLAELGTEIKFWKVAMRPGKPVVFGMIEGIPIFGLPGNPVSSMISFQVFVRPAILKMLGQSSDSEKEISAVLEEDIKKKRGFRSFLRAQTEWKDGEYHTHTTGPQGSGILKSMILANSLITLPEEEEYLEKGRRVTVRFLDSGTLKKI